MTQIVHQTQKYSCKKPIDAIWSRTVRTRQPESRAAGPRHIFSFSLFFSSLSQIRIPHRQQNNEQLRNSLVTPFKSYNNQVPKLNHQKPNIPRRNSNIRRRPAGTHVSSSAARSFGKLPSRMTARVITCHVGSWRVVREGSLGACAGDKIRWSEVVSCDRVGWDEDGMGYSA